MSSPLSILFDTGDFPARWHCGMWTEPHGWLHIVSDIAIFGAYTSIPLLLGVFIMRRRDVPFLPIFYLFAAFIFACGTSHLVEAIIFWKPIYRFAGLIKLITAVVSWTTVLALIPTIPRALSLKSPRELERLVAQRTAELERSNRSLDEFAYAASHDLKAPLRAIGNLAEWVEQDAGARLEDDSRRHLGMLRERVEELQRMLDDLLDYARVERSAGGEIELVDTGEAARHVAALVPPPTGFTIDIGASMPALRAPRAAVELVLRNLVSNAIAHHHRETGRIRIAGRRLADAVELTIADDGPGIPAPARERIFQLFTRLAPHAGDHSSGMGLAMVKKVLGAHDATIAVEDAPGGGALFRIRWPDAAA